MRKTYNGKKIDVSFDAKRCIHAAECVKNLPKVFDTKRRPWINTSNADVDSIVRVVEMCPSGALEYDRKDGHSNECHNQNVISVGENNEIYIKGNFTFKYKNEAYSLNRAIFKGQSGEDEYPFYTLDD